MQPTALVHEAYLRLAEQDRAQWTSKAQFLRVASEMMRRILVNYERDRSRIKRGGNAKKHDLCEVDLASPEQSVDLLALDEALDRLRIIDARKVEIVNLRFFAGLSLFEVAHALGISLAQAKREWVLTRSWLMREVEAP